MQYRALINSVLREVAREVRETVLPAFAQWKQFGDSATAQIRDNENWFTSLKLLGGFLEMTIRPEITEIFDHMAHVHTDDFATEIRRRTSVDVGAIVRDEDLDDILRDRVSQNVALIKSMHQTLLGDVERMVYEAKMQGKSHKDLKSELVDRFGIANRKAALIARDQMASLNSDFNQIRQEQAGIEKYEWHTSEDERVRKGKRPHNHRVLNGKVYKWGEKTGAEQGLPPGKPINCFVGSDQFFADHGINRLFRYSASVETAKIITKSGCSFEATPNHPMLTNCGWKPVHALDVGDDLIQAEFPSFFARDVDVKQRHPTFDQAFNFFRAFSHDIRKALGGDLYGEMLADEEIEIVTLPCKLPNEFEPDLAEKVGEFILKKAFVSSALFSRNADFMPVFRTHLTSPYGIVRCLRELQLFLVAQSGHADKHRFAAVSEFYSSTLHEIRERFSLASDFSGKRKDTFPFQVSVDRIREIEFHRIMGWAINAIDRVISSNPENFGKCRTIKASFGSDTIECLPGIEFHNSKIENIIRYRRRQFVYSINTNLGWYSTNQIVSGNCRCVATAIIELEEFKPKPPPKPEPEPEKPKPKPKPKKLDLTKYQPNARYQPTAKKGRIGNPSLRGHQVRKKLLDSSKPAIVKQLEAEYTKLQTEIDQIKAECKSGTLSGFDVYSRVQVMKAKANEMSAITRGIAQEKVDADLRLLQIETRGEVKHVTLKENSFVLSEKEEKKWEKGFEKIKDDYHGARERLAAHMVPEMLEGWDIVPSYHAGRAHAASRSHQIFVAPLSEHKYPHRYVIEHEITHVIEYEKKKSNAAAIAFREKRRGNEQYQRLSKLENNSNYDNTEVSFEDEWVKRGNRRYAGKKYAGNNNSEILTMGVERYFQDPRWFAIQDPEYFDLIVDFMRGHLEK